MTEREALKLALEALELEDMACRYEKDQTPEHITKAIVAIKEALTQPVIDKSAAVRIATALGWEPKRKPLEGVIDVQPIGYHSLQLIFRSQTDIEKFKAAHGIKE